MAARGACVMGDAVPNSRPSGESPDGLAASLCKNSPRTRCPRRLGLAAAGISLVGFLARPAAAADVLTFVVGGSVIRDTNLFRLPDSADPPFGKASKADTIRIGYL